MKRAIFQLKDSMKQFLLMESSGGILLFLVSFLALIFSNTSLNPLYSSMKSFYLVSKSFSLNFIVNDILMSIFFLLVGLEIKKELVSGSLSSLKKASFPLIGALGGMIVPAFIFIFINFSSDSLIGWGIPMATDIAFSLGVLYLVASRLPMSIKIFLLALAIVDDIGAILVIALFYTSSFNFISFMISTFLFLVLFLMNKKAFKHLYFHFLIFFLAWYFVLSAGIHPSIAGVVFAFLIPINFIDSLIHKLHPWVSFFILPTFAFFNAGVKLPLEGFFDLALKPLSLGIFFGLLLGKPLGIFLFTYLSQKFKITELPEGVRWSHVIFVGFLAGIGFTMSLFIASLAFSGSYLEQSKISVIFASLISGIIAIILSLSFKKN